MGREIADSLTSADPNPTAAKVYSRAGGTAPSAVHSPTAVWTRTPFSEAPPPTAMVPSKPREEISVVTGAAVVVAFVVVLSRPGQ